MQFICSFLLLNFETGSGAGCAWGFIVINTLESCTCLCLFSKVTSKRWQLLASDLLLERLYFEHAAYPVVNLQIVIC